MKKNVGNQQYNNEILKKMALIFHKNQDIMQGATTKLPQRNPHAQQILFKQYPMQKIGKKFHIMEERIFRIDDGFIKQIGKNGEERDLPYPSAVTPESIEKNNKTDWGFPAYPYRLMLEFEERNCIFVYMKLKQQFKEVYLFLLSKAKPFHKDVLKASLNKQYKAKLMVYFLSNFSKVRMSKNYCNIGKKRKITILKMKQQFNNQNLLKQMILQWHRKSVMTNINLQKQLNNPQSNVLNVKNIVSQLSFNLQQLRCLSEYSLKKGQIKLWVGQMTHGKIIKFSQIISQKYSVKPKKNEKCLNPFQQVTVFDLGQNQIKIKSQTPPLNIWTVLQFQIDALNQQNQIQSWKSQRFHVIDFIKSLTSGPKKTITLWNNKRFIQLLLTATNAKCQAIKIELPPQHQSFPSSYTYNLSPNQYPIMRQIIPPQILRKYIKSVSNETIHLQYIIAYQQYLQTESVQSLCFSNFMKLYDLLSVDSLIQKFYSAHPYNQYINIEHKATFIYEYLVKKAQRFAYYDAEKFIWKYQCTNLRRFLSVIKAFDEHPRINYTEPFFHLCMQCLKIAEKQSLQKWKSHLFANSLMGRESLAFFLVLSILKLSAQILLHQVSKQVLSNNSLLFHYTLKKHRGGLYNKFLHIQLNIEALFGIESVSIFSSLFNNYNHSSGVSYGGSDEVFMFALNSFILERREQLSKLGQPNDNAKPSENNSPHKGKQPSADLTNIRANHNISLAAMFLAIIDLFDIVVSSKMLTPHQHHEQVQVETWNDDGEDIVGDSAAYSSANAYIEYLRIFSRTKLQVYMLQLSLLYKKYYNLCELEFVAQSKQELSPKRSPQSQTQLLGYSQYIMLQQNVQKFHASCRPSISSLSPSKSGVQQVGVSNINLGELLQQLYSQFICYKHKNEADIRKLCILIDNINLGQYIAPTKMSESGSLSALHNGSSYRPPSLQILLLQNGIKLYEHQLVITNKYEDQANLSNISQLCYQNIKHTIQLKLTRLSNIHLIITYNSNNVGSMGTIGVSNDSSISYCTVIDPKELPSNYYLQLTRELHPITNLHTLSTHSTNFIASTLQYFNLKESASQQHLLQYQSQLPNININTNTNTNSTRLVYDSKITDIASSRYVCMQAYIKDSCEVDYIENMMPNQYINTLLLRDRLPIPSSPNQPLQDIQAEEYKKDIIFCNQYFRTFRLPENNFNLLYAKLGWYGNHYLVPADRVTTVYALTNTPSHKIQNNHHAPGSLRNHQPTVSAMIHNNISEVEVQELPNQQRQRINEILFYTRCIYGRGLVPAVTYPTSNNNSLQLLMESVRCNKLVVKQYKEIKHEINQCQYNSCSSLVGYLLDNFNTINNTTSSSTGTYTAGLNHSINMSSYQESVGYGSGFVDFYCRAVEQLPLIRYLGFRTLQFYLLNEARMTLKVLPLRHQPKNSNMEQNDIKNYGSNPSFNANKIKGNSQSPPMHLHKTTSNQSQNMGHSVNNYIIPNADAHGCKIYQVVLTNDSININPYAFIDDDDHQSQQYPYPFINDPSYFTTQLYTTYTDKKSAHNQNTKLNPFNLKILYQRLLEDQNLPNTFYFTYPTGISGTTYHQGMDGVEGLSGATGSGDRDLLVDQFLWLLKMNIFKYYILDASTENPPTQTRKKQKSKQKKQKKSSNDLQFDCQIKFADSSIPNMSVSSLYQMICETKLGIELLVTPILPMIQPEGSSSKNTANASLFPIILNPVYRHYTSYANFSNIWSNVCVLARVTSPNNEMYYAEEKYTRRYKLIKSSDLILSIETKRMLDKIPSFKFTDFELLSGKECVRKELAKIL